jgi:hypothetical protein
MATAASQAGATPPVDPRATSPAGGGEAKESWSDHIKTIGGLVAVALGVVAVTAIAVVAIEVGTEIAGTIASAAGGVIASIVGAFFGVKVGTDQTRNAVEGERRQAAKATVFAAHLPEGKATDVLRLAESIARGGPIPAKGTREAQEPGSQA